MTFLDRDLATAAICWRLERRDGVALGFTAHDREMVIDGLAYLAAPGMVPGAVSTGDGFDAGALEVSGALSSGAIAESDLMAGRWDGASVRVFMVDWEAPEGERVLLARGTLGDVGVTGGGFEAELRGPAAALERPVVERTSPECRAELGDRRCRIDMAARTRVTRVAEVIGEDVVRVEAALAGADHGYGRLRWIGGANSGLVSAVMRSAGSVLTLREAPPFAVAGGDLVEVREGCDKRLETCAGRFGNAVNFRGEPHLPGMDLLTRYSGG